VKAETHVDGVVTLLTPAECNACHGPPQLLDGGTETTHTVHLTGGQFSRPVACATCHTVPDQVATATHPNGSVDLTIDAGFDSSSLNCANACHLSRSPPWTSSDALTCTSCHEAPPPYPHPQLADCSVCHPSPVRDRSSHVNGQIDVAVPTTCDGCHGSAANPAPPRDLDGATDTSRIGVGAHQTHVVGRGTSRPVPCGECHVVPTEVRSAGHLDGTTQVRFSGAATANLATPAYSAGTCSNTACHDVSNWRGGSPGGGTATAPVWTSVDGGQATCTSCHGQPPPAPHPARPDCATCHVTTPDVHVNGRVDFVTVP
jgi:predicted CxxxxCH...CXXCH cytochrome family protein